MIKNLLKRFQAWVTKSSSDKEVRATKIKIALRYTIVTFIILVVLVSSFYIFFSKNAYKNFDSSLYNRVLSINASLSGQEDRSIKDLNNVESLIKNFYQSDSEFIFIIDASKNVLYESSNINLSFPQTIKEGFYTLKGPEEDKKDSFIDSHEDEYDPYRAYFMNLGSSPYFLVVARNYDDLTDSLHDVLFTFIIVIPFVLLLTAFLSFRFATAAIKPLEESITKLKQFTSDASHELKTPLTTIKTNIEVSLMKEDRSESYYREKMKIILDSVDRMSRLVQEMLYISKIDTENYPVNISDVNIGELFDSLRAQFEGMASSKNITTTFEALIDTIKTDKDILFEILSVLLENAILYNKENGSVKVTALRDGNTVRIVVKDTGIGIKKEQLPFIFDRFYRADESRSRETGGAGLGLSIAKRLSHLIKGDIIVESEYGVGSTFTIILKE